MLVLVAVASRHGSTLEIGEQIGDVLRGAGLTCDVRPAGEVTSLEGYDAVVVGSAVYTGRWLADARDLVDAHVAELVERPVWLFSSGLADSPAKASNRPAETVDRMNVTGAIAHRHFPGKLDLNVLNFSERAIIAAARGKQGDRRDMAAVREWAGTIAGHLVGTPEHADA